MADAPSASDVTVAGRPDGEAYVPISSSASCVDRASTSCVRRCSGESSRAATRSGTPTAKYRSCRYRVMDARKASRTCSPMKAALVCAIAPHAKQPRAEPSRTATSEARPSSSSPITRPVAR